MAELVDGTGRPGPATWQGGDSPEGQDDYPVSGVSWYEVAAYAEFAHKSLPTGNHWGMAQGRGRRSSRASGSWNISVLRVTSKERVPSV